MPIEDFSLVPEKVSVKIYDTTDSTHVAGDPNTSRTVHLPSHLAFEGLTAMTSFKVQARLHPNGAWHDLTTVDGSVNALAMVEFASEFPFNFVRVTRTGADNAIIYAQLKAGGYGQ